VAKTITIIGGGLAGLTLGIGLRRAGIPVTIWETGRYPRHRVCGEFISGRGQGSLQRLELWKPIQQAGAAMAHTVAFFSPTRESAVRPLPQPALCPSRLVLDALLAERFQQLGGDLRQSQPWPGADFAEGIVRASGRRSRPVENGWRWFGLKVHAENVSLTADLEMHLSPAGYVGISRLPKNAVNVCGLFRRAKSAHEPPKPWWQMLCGHRRSLLHERLQQAIIDESSFCSVAGLPLHPQRAAELEECCIGDALTMIPPVTGNGMSMAFESAELAVEHLAAYSRGEASWKTARQRIASACDEQFAQRLRWAKWVQWLMFSPLAQGSFGPNLLRSEWLWRAMFNFTR